MIIYMLLNTVTEKIYIGATKYSLEHRLKKHWASVLEGSETCLHKAMRTWPSEFWDAVILCNCYSLLELSNAEQAWQQKCHAFDPNIGYNESTQPYIVTHKAPSVLTCNVKSSSPLFGMSPEERREYFRNAGKRGAPKAKQSS